MSGVSTLCWSDILYKHFREVDGLEIRCSRYKITVVIVRLPVNKVQTALYLSNVSALSLLLSFGLCTTLYCILAKNRLKNYGGMIQRVSFA